MTEYRECELPGGGPGCGEWCRYYCMLNGRGRCHYDAESGKMLVEVEE